MEEGSAYERLVETLEGRDGVRRAVPVVGAGMNMEANPDTDEPGWGELIARVARREDLVLPKRAPESMLAWWEHLIGACAERYDEPSHRAEARLQHAVVAELRELEDRVNGRGRGRTLYDELIEGGYRDIISYNFDRRLACAGEGKLCRAVGMRPAAGVARRDYDALILHDRCGGTRVWYPHGCTKVPSTIKTGARQYGTYIGALERARTLYKQRERVSVAQSGWAAFAASVRESPRNWFELFMVSDLVFVGLSLGPDEWDLWWALHQRARNFARRPEQRPRTFVLTEKERGPSGSPAGVETVELFRHEIWRLLAGDRAKA